jgi:hypothetical protein
MYAVDMLASDIVGVVRAEVMTLHKIYSRQGRAIGGIGCRYRHSDGIVGAGDGLGDE